MLRIELDSGTQALRCGDPISGQVHVEVEEARRCRALEIELCCHCIGRSGEPVGRRQSASLFSGEWAAKSFHSVPSLHHPPAERLVIPT